ncbi:MAG: aminotransferase class V-fold PLP-dependent enzyme [Myxococcota bacterium]
METLYFDHAAYTPLEPAALEAMAEVSRGSWGNPESLHTAGRRSYAALQEARAAIGSFLDVDPTELHFFASATEALRVAVSALSLHRSGLLVSSSVEHPGLAEVVESRRRSGQPCQLLDAPAGDLDVSAATRVVERADVVALSACNHELGTAPGLRELMKQSPSAHWIIDAVQAAPWLELRELFDARSCVVIGSSKLGGPPGIAALRVPHQLRYVIEQLEAQRGSPPSWLLAIGFAAAVRAREAEQSRGKRLARARLVGAALLDGLRQLAPTLVHNAGETWLGPIVNVSVPGVSAEAFEHALDLHGVAVSRVAACRQRAEQDSRIVRHAFPTQPWRASTSTRWSVGHQTTLEDVREALTRTREVLASLRPGEPAAAEKSGALLTTLAPLPTSSFEESSRGH